MRVIFVNLHANEMLLKTLPKFVFKQSCAIKHGYLLDYLLNSDIEVCSYINSKGFSLMHNGNKYVLKLLNLFRFIEHNYVLKKNKIQKNKIKVLKNQSEIKNDDIVILYRHCKDQFNDLDNIEAYKVISMIHFWGSRIENKLINNIKPDCLINESNLRKNSEIFRRYYDYNGEWIIHPFVNQPRFKNNNKFSERKNKAFSVGTITYKNDPDFVEVYGDPCDQPSRKQIKDNPEYLEGCVDCYSSYYNEDSKLKATSANDNKFIAFYKKLYNRFNSGQQKKYFSFDMVEKFNEYKMCIVGEEILGVPGIGFVEGMACGCAYIGLDSPMYTDLGLYPGEHYIGYDGSLEDLKRIITYYQKEENQKELEEIATNGYEYVKKNFNSITAAENLIKAIIEKQQNWLKGMSDNDIK